MHAPLVASTLAATIAARPASAGALLTHGLAAAWVTFFLAIVALAAPPRTTAGARVIGAIALLVALALLVHGTLADTPFNATTELIALGPILPASLIAATALRPAWWHDRATRRPLLFVALALALGLGLLVGFIGALATMR